MTGYRGEPWSTDGKYLYDRNGFAFGEVYGGAEEFARTICLAVNLLDGLPLRETDPPGPFPKSLALGVLRGRWEEKGLSSDGRAG